MSDNIDLSPREYDVDIYLKDHDFGEGDKEVEFVLLEDYENLRYRMPILLDSYKEKLTSAFHSFSVSKKRNPSYEECVALIDSVTAGPESDQ